MKKIVYLFALFAFCGSSAIVTDSLSVWPFPLPTTVGPPPDLSAVTAITGASEAVGFVFRAPRAGTIDKIGWATRTVTTGATLDIRLETVNTNGVPSGTLQGTNTNGSQVVGDTDDNTAFETTLTAGAVVAKGDKLAIVIQQPGASYGNFEVAMFPEDAMRYPKALRYTSSAWSTTGGIGAPVAWVHYTTSPEYVPIVGFWPIGTAGITTDTISDATTPDVVGAYFQVPVSRRLRGVYFYVDLDGACNVRLVSTAYHQGNGTGILATAGFVANEDMNTSSATFGYVEFDTAVTLAANTWYRLIIEPSSSTSMSVYDFSVPTSALLAAYGGSNFYFTSAKDPTGDGDWTNTNTRVPFLWLVFDGTDQAAGSGSSHLVVQ